MTTISLLPTQPAEKVSDFYPVRQHLSFYGPGSDCPILAQVILPDGTLTEMSLDIPTVIAGRLVFTLRPKV